MSGKPERPQIIIGPYLGEVTRARCSLSREASTSSVASALNSNSDIGKRCVSVVPHSEELTASVYGGQGKAQLGKDSVAIALRTAVGLKRRLCL